MQTLETKKKRVMLLVMLVIFVTGADIAVQFVMKDLIDRLTQFFFKGGGMVAPSSILFLPALGIVFATLTSSILASIYNYQLFKNVTRTEDDVRAEVTKKYYLLHAMFHQGSSSGQIIGRIERGASAIYAVLAEIFGHNLLPPLIVFVSVLATLLYKDPWIALAVFLPLPVYILSTKRISEKIYEIEKRVNTQFEEVSKEAYDIAANIHTVKKFYQEEAEVGMQKHLLREARSTQYNAERLWSIMEIIQTLIAVAGKIGVLLLAGFFTLTGRSTIGEFVLYISLHTMAYAPMGQLSNVLPRLRRNAARIERMFEILDETVLVKDSSHAISLPLHHNSVEFRDLWFRYGKEREWTLRNIDVFIPYGSVVALVGRSGSGKTTLINLLLRSFDPERGSVRVDDRDLRDITRKSLLDQIAVVPQEVDLFSRSIFANIAYGKPKVHKKAVEHAAKNALAHDFIIKTERGYDTLVGERGIKLSGGERQRIGIARAILRDPRILILDEATSHLDTESERLIAQATDALMKNRTTVIIAHRLSTVLRADKILVFNNGMIEAMGTHEEVLQKSPTYQKLYTLQFSDT